MSGGASDPALLSLHGVRVLGAPSTAQVADRFGLRAAVVAEHLLDAQAYGWVRRHEFFGETWSMTERGRAAVAEAHRLFLSLNGPHGVACTNWQVRPTRWDRLAANDHTDADWDVAVLLELERLDNALQQVDALLSGALPRMKGYGRLHREALHRVRLGGHEWLDGPDRASCQLVWIQLHEDLLATLGIARGTDEQPVSR